MNWSNSPRRRRCVHRAVAGDDARAGYFADPHVIGPCRRDARPETRSQHDASLVASFAPQLPTSCGPYSR